MAATSLVFGLCAILIPLLAVPGFILGVVSLRRIKGIPSLRGRGRSIAGIITSLACPECSRPYVRYFSLTCNNRPEHNPAFRFTVQIPNPGKMGKSSHAPSMLATRPSSTRPQCAKSIVAETSSLKTPG